MVIKTTSGGIDMQHIREPINSITHLIGMILAILALPFVLIKSESLLQLIGVTVFIVGLIGLYGTSSMYHGLKKPSSTLNKWRKADHIMIYILIAATYTPICLLGLEGLTGIILLSVIWALSILGIVFKVLWINMPRKVYTAFYVVLGWAAVFAIYPLYITLGGIAVILLAAGGISYTIGALVYARKSSFSLGKFGFHEIFHLFILLGSLCHFLMIYYYVL